MPPVPPLLDALSPPHRSIIKYLDHGSLRTLEDEAPGFGWDPISKSQSQRESAKAMATLLEELSSRSLHDVQVAAVMVDGTPVGGRTIVWALGVTMEGQKIPLGIHEAGTETSDMVATMLRGLGDRGLETRDVLWVIDGGRALRKGIHETTRGEPAIQRCLVHKARNVVIDNLPADERDKLGMEIRKELWRAWNEQQLEGATAGLEAAATRLEQLGHAKAAASVREGLEPTLTLHRLGIEDPDVRRSLASTNAIESVHARVSHRTGDVKRWAEAPHPMRQQHTVAAIACAEPSWDRVRNAPALQRLSFAVMEARHEAITIEAELGAEPGGAVDVRRVAFAEGDHLKAYSALKDLLAWADRHGLPVAVAERALGEVATARNVVTWLESRGFAEADGGWMREPRSSAERAVAPAVTVRGPVRDRAAGDPLQGLRDHLDDELLAAVADAALAAAPRIADAEPAELAAEAGRLVAATEQLATAREDAAAWWDAERGGAARQLALERVDLTEPERGAQDPLGGGRRAVLGPETARELADEAARFAGWLEGCDEEYRRERAREIGDPLAGLDAIARRVDALGTAVAAAREEDRRELVASVTAQAPDAEVAIAGIRPTQRYADLLGGRRAELVRTAADAIAPQLGDLDPGVLGALHRATDPGFERLDGRLVLRALRVEQRRLVNARADRETAMRALGHAQQRGARDAADRAWAEAQAAGRMLAEHESHVVDERARPGSVHQLLVEHPFVAFHDAVHAELGERRERELAQAALDAVELQAAAAPSIEA